MEQTLLQMVSSLLPRCQTGKGQRHAGAPVLKKYSLLTR